MENTRTLAMVVTLASGLAGIACGGAKSSPTAPPPPAAEAHAHTGSQPMAGMCPMQVQGTHVAAEDTPDGVAISFTTSGDVAQLRERVHKMAAMHEHMMGGGMMGSGGGMMGSGSGGMMGSGSGAMKMVPSNASAVDIEGGARIVLVPKDPSQLAELRAHVHAHAEMMASGHCPMMKHGA